jgi:hypothetical protein
METRVCRKCNKEFPLTEEFFKKTKLMSCGFYKTCKKCVAQYTPEYGRYKQLERRHKMTVEEYEERLIEQGGHCALCSARQGDDRRRMAIDHDHACCDKELACGKCNRGILCANCNRKIGFLEVVLKEGTIVPNKGTWLERAMRYLDSYKNTAPTQA